MRYLVITDIHANLEALDACLDRRGEPRLRPHARARRHRRLRARPERGDRPDRQPRSRSAIVRGNHDKIAFGHRSRPKGSTSARARQPQWTLNALTPGHRDWLVALPQGPTVVDDAVEICHGSPFDEDEYIFDELDARRAIDASRQRLCLFGHTHVAMVFRLAGRVDRPESRRRRRAARIEAESKYLVNPGSVGQPRDGDPRAAYVDLRHGRAARRDVPRRLPGRAHAAEDGEAPDCPSRSSAASRPDGIASQHIPRACDLGS